MAWYYGTHSCGHEGRTNIVGPVKNRQWISDRNFKKMCPECWEKHLIEERERANKEAAEKAVEMELSELQGTPKQVAWANTLRQKMIDTFEKRIEISEEKMKKCTDEKLIEKFIGNVKIARETLNFILQNKKSASWYIDSRNEDIEDLFRQAGKEMETEEEQKRPEVRDAKQEQENIKRESTVYPENVVTEVVAEIKITEEKISITFEKNEKFREIVKSLGYEWTGCWERKIDKFNGPAEDRAAELGNKLLNAGFPIMIYDSIVRQNAIEGKFELECTRWIYRTKGEHEGKFAINWKERSDRIYNTARKLPGSKYDSPSVIVRVEHYREVEDFAKLFGFKFSEAAIQAIEQHKKAIAEANIVTPKKVESKNMDGLKDILNSSDAVIDDLKDGE
jgi:hypothetical protein